MFLERASALVALLAGASALAAPPAVAAPSVAWAETPDRITPFVADVSAGGTFRFTTFVPKGTVVVHDGSSPSRAARVLSLQPPRDEKHWRSPFQINAPVNTPIGVPRGRAVAMVLDEKERVIGVSDPLIVETAPVAWEHRYDRLRTVLIATIERGGAAGDVALFANDTVARRPPDVSVSDAASMTAIWYQLHDGP